MVLVQQGWNGGYLLWVTRWEGKLKRGKGSEVLKGRELGLGVGIERRGSEERKGERRVVVGIGNSICFDFEIQSKRNN